ncbi:hypothetical protein [Agarivorans sp. Toyoura001]|uniref:hypothetical protein n=1 Tax=Agarivorans sp. Toyoura001 TaxID=2283141 RepID=UPI0010F7201A|nr:hypothetical protein [Agarivorans sp. Toyoura001]
MVEVSSLIFFLLTLVLIILYVKNRVSLFSFVCFAPITFFGALFNIGFLTFGILLPFFIDKFKMLRLKKAISVSFSISMVTFFVIFLSYLNDASLILNFVKYIQTIVVWTTLILFAYSKEVMTERVVKKLSITYVTLIFFSGIVIHFLFNGYDEGMIRFSAIYFDANYFGLVCLLLYFILDIYRINSYRLKNIFFLMVFASLSSTAIACLLVYIIVSKTRFIPILNGWFLYFLILILNAAYINMMVYLEAFKPSDDSSMFITYKLVSLSHRLRVQFDALDMISNNYGWAIGYGSGRNIELVGLALHNGFLQYIFSHGIVYFLLNVFIICYSYEILRFRTKKTRDRRKLMAIYLALVLSCFLLDPFISLFMHVVALFYSSYINYQERISLWRGCENNFNSSNLR